MAVKERPSYWSEGAGRDGGGVEDRGGRVGEDALDELSRFGVADSTPS